MSNIIEHEIKTGHRKADNKEEVCPICRCDLFDDDLLAADPADIEAYTWAQECGKKPYDVVLMDRCTDHPYHRECLQLQLQSKGGQYLRCSTCNQVYGVRTGDMPSGKMTWNLRKMRCSGFKE